MRTYSSFERGGYVFAIEDVMLPIHVFFSFLGIFTFAKVELGRLCYGRAYLDFNPERFVSCSSPLIELVPVVEIQLVIIWGQGSPMVL